jgi:hypothetical protein
MTASHTPREPLSAGLTGLEDLERTINSLYDSYCDPATDTDQLVDRWRALADARDHLKGEIYNLCSHMRERCIESFLLGMATGLRLRVTGSAQIDNPERTCDNSGRLV